MGQAPGELVGSLKSGAGNQESGVMCNESLKTWKEELEQELRGNILPWWEKYAPDVKNGGFHGHIDHRNAVVEGAPKGAVLHARILWTFSAAFRSYKANAYRKMAERALDYMREHFIDPDFGGVYWDLEADGGIRSDRKQIYALAFTIYGLSEYYLATGDEQSLLEARYLFHDIETNALDRERGGYTDALTRDWLPAGDLRLSDKDQNESKTMNTHLHILEAYTNLYRCWQNPVLEKALEDLLLLMKERFTDRGSGHLHLFFNDHWELKSDLVSYGHDIEASWLMYEAAEVLGKKEYMEELAELAVHMAGMNLQGVGGDGGLAYEYFPGSGELDDDRHWWPQAEAVVGYFNAWELSGRDEFLHQSLRSWGFIKKYLVDRQYGEWIWSVAADGSPRTEKEKAGFWKCPYHNGRACMEVIRRISKLNGTDLKN